MLHVLVGDRGVGGEAELPRRPVSEDGNSGRASNHKQQSASDDYGHQVEHITRRAQGGKELMVRGIRIKNDVEVAVQRRRTELRALHAHDRGEVLHRGCRAGGLADAPDPGGRALQVAEAGGGVPACVWARLSIKERGGNGSRPRVKIIIKKIRNASYSQAAHMEGRTSALMYTSAA